MKIKAVEELLGLSRANIRFYEDKGLLSPDRSGNRYREYSEADIERLKKIIILRKMGVSLEDISAIINRKAELNEVLQKRSGELQAEIEQLGGALALCDRLVESGVSIDTLDEAACMETIEKAEAEGKTFVDICKDYIEFEENNFLMMWKYTFFTDLKSTKARYGRKGVAITVLILCTLRGLGEQFLWGGNFFEGFFYPFILFFAGTLILTPIYILSQKHPKTAGVIADIIVYLCIAFFVLLALGIVLLLVNQVFHFGW